jgi:hypothetical protein
VALLREVLYDLSFAVLPNYRSSVARLWVSRGRERRRRPHGDRVSRSTVSSAGRRWGAWMSSGSIVRRRGGWRERRGIGGPLPTATV